MVPENNGRNVFVFGSNLDGRHGKGAAIVARRFGAKYGLAAGLSGNSFAIPTKYGVIDRRHPLGRRLLVLDLQSIQGYVNIFIAKARELDTYNFFVTRIGCGYAGYRDEQIAPMFASAPTNCSFAEEWREHLSTLPTYDISI
jgi:hypothetical protein